jgi:hypothetical protein
MRTKSKETKKGVVMINEKYIRFDWAVKRMLRDKANFGVLEGLITVLLGEQIKIDEILESEGNQMTDDDKFNRVDIKAKDSEGNIIIVEVQLTTQLFYLERILYGVAKAITEHISLGQRYSNVKKVYSINILYFDLGQGADYLYHGRNTFVGVHTGDTLKVNIKENNVIRMKAPEEVFPEYYLIRVNEFNDVATTPIEEWLDYLKNGRIKDDTTTPGLAEAREKLLYMQMSRADQLAYERHLDALAVQSDAFDAARIEGHAEGHELGLAEGRAEGRAEGLAEGRVEGRAEGRAEGELSKAKSIARKMKEMGATPDFIIQATGLTAKDIDKL